MSEVFVKENIDVGTERQFARELARLAESGANSPDFQNFAKARTLSQVYYFARACYQPEHGEIILHPSLFVQIQRGDCDDQAIFLASYALARGACPSRVFFVFASFDDRPEEDHVFIALAGKTTLLFLDPSPGMPIGGVVDFSDARAYSISDLLGVR